MRHLLIPAALLIASASSSLAQNAPVFRPLDPTMTTAPAAPAPTVTPVAPAAPAAQAMPSAPAAAPAPLPVAHNGEVIDSAGSGAIPALPLEAKMENGISYLSGGISDEETDQLKMQEDSYNLRLLITGQSGEFVSDVSMILRDASGAVLLNVSDAGPCIYAHLPAGKYTVSVANATASKNTSLTVPARGAVKTQVRI